MTQTALARLTFAFFLTTLLSLGLSGRPTLHLASLTLAVALSGLLLFRLRDFSRIDGFTTFVGRAIFACVAFALWNLAGHPNDRWAHRTFIYTSYAAAAAIVLLATTFNDSNHNETSKWCTTGGIYLATTLSIALIKPCFVDRMMNIVSH